MDNLSLELKKYIAQNFGTNDTVKNNDDDDYTPIMHEFLLTYNSLDFNATYRRN